MSRNRGSSSSLTTTPEFPSMFKQLKTWPQQVQSQQLSPLSWEFAIPQHVSCTSLNVPVSQRLLLMSRFTKSCSVREEMRELVSKYPDGYEGWLKEHPDEVAAGQWGDNKLRL